MTAGPDLVLVCPKCKSGDIAAIDQLIGHAIGRVLEDRDTALRTFDPFGETQVDWNSAETIGLQCRSCYWQALGDSAWRKLKFDPRDRVCPECGGGKAEKAELCVKCRRHHKGDQAARPRQISEDELAAAYARWMAGEAALHIAESLADAMPHLTARQLADQLRHEWLSRGWPQKLTK